MTSEKKRVLVVDDDEDVLKSISDYLRLKGYAVETAKSGQEAMEKSKNHFFHVAILDIKLPDREGTELLTELRDTEPKMIKVILTGYPSMDNSVTSLNKGANAYLVKPVEMKDLVKIIEQKLKQQETDLEMDQKKVIRYIESRDRQHDEDVAHPKLEGTESRRFILV